jgi:succinate dehydrogenase hydrophobic anchor subunit
MDPHERTLEEAEKRIADRLAARFLAAFVMGMLGFVIALMSATYSAAVIAERVEATSKRVDDMAEILRVVVERQNAIAVIEARTMHTEKSVHEIKTDVRDLGSKIDRLLVRGGR